MRDPRVQDLFEQVKQSEQALRNSRGFLIFDRLGAIRASLQVFRGNHVQLLAALEQFRDPAFYLPTLDVEHPERLDDFLLEVTRLLHNYVASAKSLLAHTHVIASELYTGHPFHQEFRYKVSQIFGELPVSRFIDGLRHFMLHDRLPFPMSHLTAERNNVTSEWDTKTYLSLTTAELRKWPRWHRRALEYLETEGAQVDVHELVTRYTATVGQFHEWLRAKQSPIHQADFEELSRLLRTLKAAKAELELG